jgi:hypothetical protein
MRKDVLNSIRKLERVYVAKPILNVRVDYELCQPQDFTAQMEGVSKSRLLALLSRERLHWLQVHVVVEMQVIQVLSAC